jgi:hypothetical protein
MMSCEESNGNGSLSMEPCGIFPFLWKGRKDTVIIEHERKGLEVLVFYRIKKGQFAGAGFRYEGRFRYVSHTGSHPTRFVLQRIETELKTVEKEGVS